MLAPGPARLMARWMVLQGAQVVSLAAGALPSTERVCTAATVRPAETGARLAMRRARRKSTSMARRCSQRQIPMVDLLTVARLTTRCGAHEECPRTSEGGTQVS